VIRINILRPDVHSGLNIVFSASPLLRRKRLPSNQIDQW